MNQELKQIAEKWFEKFELHPRDRIKGALTEALAPVERERDELQEVLNISHRLCNSAEERGFDKAKEHFESRIQQLEAQLATAREGALREVLKMCGKYTHVGGIYREVTNLLATTPAKERVGCEWIETEICWQTGCGESFIIIDGTPAQNSMKFCPYCGKPIQEKGSK